jgi:hypothetical protein
MEYEADSRNLKRGWGLCCSKYCAAQKREKSRPDYDIEIVKVNNKRRDNWHKIGVDAYDPADSEYWMGKDVD